MYLPFTTQVWDRGASSGVLHGWAEPASPGHARCRELWSEEGVVQGTVSGAGRTARQCCHGVWFAARKVGNPKSTGNFAGCLVYSDSYASRMILMVSLGVSRGLWISAKRLHANAPGCLYFNLPVVWTKANREKMSGRLLYNRGGALACNVTLNSLVPWRHMKYMGSFGKSLVSARVINSHYFHKSVALGSWRLGATSCKLNAD